MQTHDSQPDRGLPAEDRTVRQGRFVVLLHVLPEGSQRPTHWDFMLETPSGLRTWALASPPDQTGPITAEALPDHRPEYLTYEGPISGGRGHVERWDAGTFQRQTDETNCLPEGDVAQIAVRLCGDRLRGLARLTADPGSPQRWRFSFTAEPT